MQNYQLQLTKVNENEEDINLYPINRAEDVMVGNITESASVSLPCETEDETLDQSLAKMKKMFSNLSEIGREKRSITDATDEDSSITLASAKSVKNLSEKLTEAFTNTIKDIVGINEELMTAEGNMRINRIIGETYVSPNKFKPTLIPEARHNINGVTTKFLADGYTYNFTSNGTNTEEFSVSLGICAVKPNTKYRLVGIKTPNTNASYCIYDLNSGYSNKDTGNGCEFTTKNNQYLANIMMVIKPNTTMNTDVRVMVLEYNQITKSFGYHNFIPCEIYSAAERRLFTSLKSGKVSNGSIVSDSTSVTTGLLPVNGEKKFRFEFLGGRPSTITIGYCKSNGSLIGSVETIQMIQGNSYNGSFEGLSETPSKFFINIKDTVGAVSINDCKISLVVGNRNTISFHTTGKNLLDVKGAFNLPRSGNVCVSIPCKMTKGEMYTISFEHISGSIGLNIKNEKNEVINNQIISETPYTFEALKDSEIVTITTTQAIALSDIQIEHGEKATRYDIHRENVHSVNVDCILSNRNEIYPDRFIEKTKTIDLRDVSFTKEGNTIWTAEIPNMEHYRTDEIPDIFSDRYIPYAYGAIAANLRTMYVSPEGKLYVMDDQTPSGKLVYGLKEEVVTELPNYDLFGLHSFDGATSISLNEGIFDIGYSEFDSTAIVLEAINTTTLLDVKLRELTGKFNVVSGKVDEILRLLLAEDDLIAQE